MNYNFNASLSTTDEKLLIKDSRIFVPDEPYIITEKSREMAHSVDSF